MKLNGEKKSEKYFNYPLSIYYNLIEEIFYIGDSCSIQLIKKKKMEILYKD